MFNNYKYDAKAEAAARAEAMATFFAQDEEPTGRSISNGPDMQNIPVRTEDGRKIREVLVNNADEEPVKPLIDTDFATIEMRAIANHLITTDKELTAKIEKTSGGGSFYSVDCPYCGKIKILSSELNSLRAVCDKCYRPFKLEN